MYAFFLFHQSLFRNFLQYLRSHLPYGAGNGSFFAIEDIISHIFLLFKWNVKKTSVSTEKTISLLQTGAVCRNPRRAQILMKKIPHSSVFRIFPNGKESDGTEKYQKLRVDFFRRMNYNIDIRCYIRMVMKIGIEFNSRG